MGLKWVSISFVFLITSASVVRTLSATRWALTSLPSLTTHPDRFITLILGGASGRRNWSADDQHRVDVESAEMDEGMLRSQILRLWPKDQPPPSDEVIRQRSAERMAGNDPKALAAVRRSNPDQIVTEAQMRAVNVPAIGIVGTADPYLREFEQLKSAMPQLQLVTIEGASHGSAPGRPEFIQALKAFLAAHPAAPERPIGRIPPRRRQGSLRDGEWSFGET